MKRFFLTALTLIVLLLLTSCGEPPTVNTDFSASFTTRIGSDDCSGSLTVSGGDMTITMAAPYTVQGMRFDYRSGALTVSYAGHSACADAGYLPCESLPSSLRETLGVLSQAVYQSTDGGTDSFTLPTPHGNAALTAKDGFPLTLTVPENRMTVTFEPIA